MAKRGSGIPVVVAGLGDIGRAIARAALETPELRLVGAIDPAVGIAGRKLEVVLNSPAPDVTVAPDSSPLPAARGGVLLQATSSSFAAVRSQIEQAVKAGLSVVSTCEELAYPWLRHEPEADALDRLCEKHDVAVVATGVNPGFALDRLPALLSQLTGPVRHVRARRVVDALRRRPALQRKVGAGLTAEAFEEAVDRGAIGHAGLAESAALAALGCGLEVDEVEEEIDPILADRDFEGAVQVKKGQVAGVRQSAWGYDDDREVVRLQLTIGLGVPDPLDEVELDADPPLRLAVPGGIPGDEATTWAVIHAAAPITLLRGLVTVLDLPAGR